MFLIIQTHYAVLSFSRVADVWFYPSNMLRRFIIFSGCWCFPISKQHVTPFYHFPGVLMFVIIQTTCYAVSLFSRGVDVCQYPNNMLRRAIIFPGCWYLLLSKQHVTLFYNFPGVLMFAVIQTACYAVLSFYRGVDVCYYPSNMLRRGVIWARCWWFLVSKRVTPFYSFPGVLMFAIIQTTCYAVQLFGRLLMPAGCHIYISDSSVFFFCALL